MSTYVPIQAITVGTAVSSIEFTGIPQTYTDLVLIAAGSTTAPTDIKIRVGNNGIDTTSNYGTTRLYGNGTSAGSDTLPQSFFYTNGSFNDSNNIINFMSYSNTGVNKTIINRTNVSGAFVGANICTWRSNTAITNIRIYVDSGNISTNATFTLYGIGSGSPKAFGGDEVKTDGTYWYHVYRSTGRFEPLATISNADVLVVAGGGGGAGNLAGGGGAGGYRHLTGQTLSAFTSSVVTVGAGGTGSLDYTSSTSGSNSSFGSTTSTGGGAGRRQTTGVDGGSGGGVFGTTGGLGTSGQGNNGGSSGQGWSGGGGGATAVGGTGTSVASGSGGNGSSSASAIGLATGTGQNSSGTVYYAGGGGGGGGFQGTAAGSGGLGGGGNGGSANAGGNGTATTGGGAGGGSWNGATAFAGGNGGSGIVIVRYAV